MQCLCCYKVSLPAPVPAAWERCMYSKIQMIQMKVRIRDPSNTIAETLLDVLRLRCWTLYGYFVVVAAGFARCEYPATKRLPHVNPQSTIIPRLLC